MLANSGLVHNMKLITLAPESYCEPAFSPLQSNTVPVLLTCGGKACGTLVLAPCFSFENNLIRQFINHDTMKPQGPAHSSCRVQTRLRSELITLVLKVCLRSVLCLLLCSHPFLCLRGSKLTTAPGRLLPI